MHIENEKCICYNANRQKDMITHVVGQRKAPERHLWGFSIPNFGNGRA